MTGLVLRTLQGGWGVVRGWPTQVRGVEELDQDVGTRRDEIGRGGGRFLPGHVGDKRDGRLAMRLGLETTGQMRARPGPDLEAVTVTPEDIIPDLEEARAREGDRPFLALSLAPAVPQSLLLAPGPQGGLDEEALHPTVGPGVLDPEAGRALLESGLLVDRTDHEVTQVAGGALLDEARLKVLHRPHRHQGGQLPVPPKDLVSSETLLSYLPGPDVSSPRLEDSRIYQGRVAHFSHPQVLPVAMALIVLLPTLNLAATYL